jgi:hypothetical protein
MIWRICRGARLRVLIAAAVLVAASAGEGAVYRWTDERGTPHYSDRPEDVPPRFRDQLRAPADVLSEAPPINVLPGLNPPTAAPEGSASDGAGATPGGQAGPGLPDGFLAGRDWRQLGPKAIGLVLGAGLLIILLVCGFGGAILLLACRICREESPGFPRAFAISFAQLIAGGASFALLVLLFGVGLESQAGGFVLNLSLSAGILRGMHCETFTKAAVVSLVSLVVSWGVGLVLSVFAVCAGVGTAFVGSMS